MKIEVFYFSGCPSYKPTLELLNNILDEEEINSPIERINVDSEELVQKHMFLGSPSIRVDGLDIEVEARTSKDFGQKCRIYNQGGVPSGIPSKSLVKKAILEAKNKHTCCG